MAGRRRRPAGGEPTFVSVDKSGRRRKADGGRRLTTRTGIRPGRLLKAVGLQDHPPRSGQVITLESCCRAGRLRCIGAPAGAAVDQRRCWADPGCPPASSDLVDDDAAYRVLAGIGRFGLGADAGKNSPTKTR